MNNPRYLFFIVSVVLCVSFVNANVVVSPQVHNLQVFAGQSQAFNLSIYNNNSFSIANLTFSPVSGVTFPSVDVLLPNELRVVNFVVFHANTGVFQGISSLSFLYDVAFNSSPVNVSVFVDDSGLSPDVLDIFVGDGVLWQNFFVNSSVDLRDVSSGFPPLSIPVNGSQFVLYSVGNFSFFQFPEGFSGSLRVLPRPLSERVHSSVFDVPLSFSVTSSLFQSSLQVSVFNNNFSSNVNQSQVGLLEVKNLLNVPVFNVSFNSSDGWIRFLDSGFDLSPLGNRFVQFNITPLVDDTDETNRSYNVLFSVRANNVVTVNSSVSLFVFYADLDSVLVNGTRYVINRLSINDSIHFCVQNPSDFECLRMVDAFKQNVTVIKEVEAKVTVSEPEIRSAMKGSGEVGAVADRLENSYNVNKDYLLGIASRFEEFADQLNRTQFDYNVSMETAHRENADLRSRQGWVLFGFFIVVSFLLIVRYINYLSYIYYLIRGGQL